MKVICIKSPYEDSSKKQFGSLRIIVGNIYTIHTKLGNSYWIYEDGNVCLISKIYFTTLEEHRDSKLNEIFKIKK